jgi:NADH:ubiquinone oxidoreductase subunit K
MIPLEHFLFVGTALFCIGIVAVITKRNAIVALMGVELILNAANINLIAFSQYDPNRLQGQMFALFVIVVAAAEAAVALAIVLKVYQYYQTVHLDKINELKEQ